jgi:hypothetical protein
MVKKLLSPSFVHFPPLTMVKEFRVPATWSIKDGGCTFLVTSLQKWHI